jgi:hypothetical protein
VAARTRIDGAVAQRYAKRQWKKDQHMVFRRRVIGMLAVLSMSGIGPAAAQAVAANIDAEQTVGLFEQSCLRFAGDPAGLRAWILAHALPQVAGGQAAPFLESGTGEVFGASTPTVKLALVSKDDGACEVIAMTDDPPTVLQILLASLGNLGATTSHMTVRSKPDLSSTQYLFDAAQGARHWKISVTSKPHADAPKLAPELRLLATPG